MFRPFWSLIMRIRKCPNPFMPNGYDWVANLSFKGCLVQFIFSSAVFEENVEVLL